MISNQSIDFIHLHVICTRKNLMIMIIWLELKMEQFFSLLSSFIFFFLLLLGCSISRVTLFEIDNLGKLVVEMYRFIKCIAELSRLLINFSMSFLILFTMVKEKNKSWKTFRIIIRVKINLGKKFEKLRINFRMYIFSGSTSTKGKLL